MQTGHIYKKVNKKGKGSWYLRYWDDVVIKVQDSENGSTPTVEKKRRLCTRKIASYPEYRSKDAGRSWWTTRRTLGLSMPMPKATVAAMTLISSRMNFS